MCNVCWKEFKGWCKSFTKTEGALTILEGILIIVCVVFIVFLVMHLTVCQTWLTKDEAVSTPQPTYQTTETTLEPKYENTFQQFWFQNFSTTTTTRSYKTLGPGVKCTWEPSKKTAAGTHYYENDNWNSTMELSTEPGTQASARSSGNTTQTLKNRPELEDVDELALDDLSDGEESDEVYASMVLALVKLQPPKDITFGCILTIIRERWTLTAASCVESIEEVDSLDNFVMMEGYGGARRSLTHAVSDVQLHPMYQGANRSYDVAALRSQSVLRGATAADLPALQDYFLITVGERFTILGFGRFRSIDTSAAERRLRAVSVYSVPRGTCAAGAEAWAPRHLSRGRAQAHGACGAGPLCAGVLYARGAPCNYCAGTPLLRGATLLGVMSDARSCGVACEPAAYVNIAVVRDWLDSVVDPD